MNFFYQKFLNVYIYILFNYRSLKTKKLKNEYQQYDDQGCVFHYHANNRKFLKLEIKNEYTLLVQITELEWSH